MTNINHVGSLDIGTYLKIFSTKGVYSNLSEESELWKMMLKKRVAKPEGREVRYLLRKARGQDAFQFLAPGAEGSFPGKSRTVQVEATAYFKDFGTTVDVPRHLLNKTGSELAQYADPLAEELDEKGIATARGLSRMLCGDGSGSLGKITAASVSSGNILLTISSATADAGRSHVGNFEMEEKILITNEAGTLQDATDSGGAITQDYCKVIDINEDNDQITVEFYETGTTSAATVTAVNEIGSGDYCHPNYEGAASDVAPAGVPNLGSITDYGQLGYMWAGLESLAADDGRLVNGLTMSGEIKGTRVDASAATIDRTHFQSLISKLKRRRGKNRYNWKEALMFDTVYDAMMESWETDRQINTQSDNKRGSNALGFTHGKTQIDFNTDEFVPKQRIFLCPEGDVLQYRGTDVEQVDVGGQKFFMPNDSSGNHQRLVRAYLEGSGLLFATDPGAIGVIENFNV